MKKVLSVLFSVLMMFGFAFSVFALGDETDINVADEEDNILIYDYNKDGYVNDLEIAVMRRKLAGWTVSFVINQGDVNGDGTFDDKDPATLAKYLAGWNVTIHC